MQNDPNNPSKIDKAITPQRVTTVSPVRRICSTQSLVAILGGLGIMTMAVGVFEYPGQSTTSASDRPMPAAVTKVATNNTPTDRTGDRQARVAIAAAQAAVNEAKRAIALSEADVAQADINIQTFQTKYERYRELHKRGAVNSRQLAQARVAHDFGKQQKQIALEGLKHARGQLTEAINLANARSQLARANGSVR
jgi:hypothetical protein